MQGERITLCQPFFFLKILRDESKEFVVINVHQTDFSYFQFLESLKRMSIGEIHPRYFFAFCVCVFISVMELKRSFFPWESVLTVYLQNHLGSTQRGWELFLSKRTLQMDTTTTVNVVSLRRTSLEVQRFSQSRNL